MSSPSPAKFSMVMIRNFKSIEDTPTKDDHLSITRDGQYFNVTYNDDEPFSHIQFNFPAVPAVMYKTSNISMVYDVLLDQFDSMIANWPVNA